MNGWRFLDLFHVEHSQATISDIQNCVCWAVGVIIRSHLIACRENAISITSDVI